MKPGNMIFNNLPLVCSAFGLVKTTRILFRKSDIDCNSPYPEFCFNSFNNSPVPPGRKVLLDQRDRRVHKVLQDSRDLPVPPGHRAVSYTHLDVYKRQEQFLLPVFDVIYLLLSYF